MSADSDHMLDDTTRNEEAPPAPGNPRADSARMVRRITATRLGYAALALTLASRYTRWLPWWVFWLVALTALTLLVSSLLRRTEAGKTVPVVVRGATLTSLVVALAATALVALNGFSYRSDRLLVSACWAAFAVLWLVDNRISRRQR
jgi:hypothetical protein